MPQQHAMHRIAWDFGGLLGAGSPNPVWVDGNNYIRVFEHPWNSEPDASGFVLTPNMPITEDMTFYAQWITQVTFNSNLDTFISAASNAQRTSHVPIGYTFRNAHTHPHAAPEYTATGGWFGIGHFPAPGSWYALSNLMAVHTGFNEMIDGSGTPFDIDTVVNGPMEVYGIWSTNVVFLENGAPSGTILAHNRERTVPAGQLIASGTCPDTGTIGMPPAPEDWPGFEFFGWTTNPEASNPLLFNPETVTIYFPIALHAVWRAVLTFDATGGTNRPYDLPIRDIPVSRLEVFRGNTISTRMPTNTVRQGWDFVEWRVGLRDSITNEIIYVGEVFHDTNMPIMNSMLLLAQWTANVTFDLQGGHVDTDFSDVVRKVLEGDTIDNNGGSPTPIRAGYTFAGWLDSDGDPVPPNFTTTPWADGHTTFYADWTPITTYFEFIKSSYVIYDGYDPAPLPNAIFRLYRLVEEGDGDEIPDEWEQVGLDVTSSETPAYGVVRFEGISFTGLYRLVEVEAPGGFQTPEGYWLVRWYQVDPMDHTTWTLDITAEEGNPEFLRIPIEGTSPTQYGFYVGNIPVDEVEFHFRKTDEQLQTLIAPDNAWDMTYRILLEGAIFELFRFYGDTPPDDMLVYAGNIGENPGQWQRVDEPQTSSDNPSDPAMMFSLTVGGVYHLVEIAAPQGFITPRGQWRIWVDEDEEGGFAIARIGCPLLPGFLWNQEDTFYVSNMPDFELPVAGGLGRARYQIAGIGMILATAGVWFILRNRRQRQLAG